MLVTTNDMSEECGLPYAFLHENDLELDDALMRRAKSFAAQRGITLTALMDRALRDVLDGHEDQASYVPEIPVVKGTGPPRVDVTDRDAMFEAMS